MQSDRVDFRPDINVVLMAPKVTSCYVATRNLKKTSQNPGNPLLHGCQVQCYELEH